MFRPIQAQRILKASFIVRLCALALDFLSDPLTASCSLQIYILRDVAACKRDTECKEDIARTSHQRDKFEGDKEADQRR